MGDQTLGGKLLLALHKAKPYLAMISLQFGFAGMYIVSLVSLKGGMSHYILAVYRHVAATLVVAPFALLFERKVRPKMTLPIFLRIAALGFLEPVLDQNLYYVGMKFTSATFTAAMVNILPGITFILAIIFRLESVNFKKIASVAKVVGTVITVSGTMVMTLYKGPIIDFIKTKGIGHHATTTTTATAAAGETQWIVGTILLIASCASWASFFILQSFTLKMYPAELSLSALVCLMGVVEGAIVSLIMERDMSVWKIGFDSRLLAATYSGVICSGIAFYIQGYVSKEKGPVFVTSFSPLCMIITAALGAILLAEKVHLGSIFGAIIIVVGLYTVVWGKSKDPPQTEVALAASPEKELPIRNTTNINGKSVNGGDGVIGMDGHDDEFYKSTTTGRNGQLV